MARPAALIAFLVLALAVGLTACGDDDSKAAGCNIDADCDFGLVCDGVCTQLPCASSGDCLNGDQACLEVNGQKVCAAVECGCANCAQCPVGETCQPDGSCGSATINTCSGPSDCEPNEICDTGTCRACEGAECPQSGCTVDGCPAGQTCNAQTGTCETAGPGTSSPCDTCDPAVGCGDGWKCAPLITGNACLPPCSNANDCSTGWACQTGNCVPESFRCSGCEVDGCAQGQACDPNDTTCKPATALCDACSDDWECGAGNACYQGVCTARCTSGSCPTGGACAQTPSGVSVCTTSCAATCDPACGGATPHCLDGACVQCTSDNDCSGEQTCDPGTNSCTGGGVTCDPPTPHVWNGGCVECITNDHCGQLFCNQGTNTCVNDTCASCADPYPACTQVGDDWYCVQCTEDSDCGTGGTCNQSTFACEGGVVMTGDPCTSAADCDPGQTGYTLQCDTNTGLCYDAAGACDDVTAFCPGKDGTVHECLSFLEAFGGGAGGGFPIPIPDLGGTTIPGFCGCTGSILTGNDSCFGGACLDLGAIFALIGGGTPTVGGSFCFSL